MTSEDLVTLSPRSRFRAAMVLAMAADALQIVETTSPREVAERFGVDPARAEILPAGVILLAEVQRRLGVTLHVCGGGIREGAVLASLEALAA